jgi:hypothetical protein
LNKLGLLKIENVNLKSKIEGNNKKLKDIDNEYEINNNEKLIADLNDKLKDLEHI